MQNRYLAKISVVYFQGERKLSEQILLQYYTLVGGFCRMQEGLSSAKGHE